VLYAALILLAAYAVERCSDDAARPTDAGGDRAQYGDRSIRVREVVDGDTAILADGTSVRYIGIDAPEERPAIQCLSREATAANRDLVGGRLVTLRLDPAETRDRFGRLLAYLEVEGEIINVELVERGVACAFPFGATRRFRAEIEAAEAGARAAGRGVWGRCPAIQNGCP
jgi:micrococcal nuclease